MRLINNAGCAHNPSWAIPERVRPGGLGNIEHSTLNVERRSGGRGILWTAAIHRRFAFSMMDLPARVRPPPPTPEAWQRVAGG